MLSQADVASLLLKDPPPAQHEAFQILAAYIYCKSSRGNLPTETLAKLISIQRKVATRSKAANVNAISPLGRAFDAAKTQLVSANRKWDTMGPRALGPLGEIGSASSQDAIWAWTKATDGKVKRFDDGTRGGLQAIDAGRVVGPAAPLQEAPPQYQPPPEEAPLTLHANGPAHAALPEVPAGGENGVEEGAAPAQMDAPAEPVKTQGEFDVEAGRANLARLYAERLKAEEAAAVANAAEGPFAPLTPASINPGEPSLAPVTAAPEEAVSPPAIEGGSPPVVSSNSS